MLRTLRQRRHKMDIVINYESSWRNSFLDGDNNEPLPKKGRNFIASMTELKKANNFIARSLTKDTILGVLNRLIGDQRKLYQSRGSGKGGYYFADLENKVSFEDIPTDINDEVVYIRNMKGSTDQNSFTGMICDNHPAFTSDYSRSFWGVLWLSPECLVDFILENKFSLPEVPPDPLSILSRFNEIEKYKVKDDMGKIERAAQLLQQRFEKYNPLDKKGKIKLLGLYCSALYLQLDRLENRFDMQTAKAKRGGIRGISHNLITPKDFMAEYTTGSKKLIYGNPYVREEYVKGAGNRKHFLTKASGKLVIHLELNLEKAKELKKMIDCAGVSAFYLGKKGLAYVSEIEVR